MMRSIGILLTILMISPDAHAQSVITAAQTQADSTPASDESGFRIGVYGGLFMTMVEDFETAFDGASGFTLAGDGIFQFREGRQALFRYQYFGKSNGPLEWNQTFINAGGRFKSVGGGLSFSSVEGSSGAGVYFEVAPDFGGLSTLLKIDFVSINGRQAGGISALFGYVF